ncbi:heat shock protein 70 family [Pisolithus orientalis]|uniref:heat shock protein 70 family n=1 Tax=Pisolithus orientalis TaxID=936130 RepID=UPI0022243398|nr:heat shock protein 70 family [Pisolithus orientalis]KAI6002593.1 heat shock protein 70 family [Pisolithus orientalis]
MPMSCAKSLNTNSESAQTTPLVVAFMKHGECLIGFPAKHQAVINPSNTVFAFKHLIGHKFKEVEVQEDMKHWAFKVVEKPCAHPPAVKSAEELLSMILTKMHATAKQYLNKEVNNAVITVPTYLNDAQWQATKDAGQITGLKPTAMALAYGLDHAKLLVIAVYDLGCGTFDTSILEMHKGVFGVKSTNRDTHLGGEDFNIALITHILNKFKKESSIDLSQDCMAIQHICKAAKKAKIELSSTMQTEINLPFITADATCPQAYQHETQLCSIQVILIGGMTCMPLLFDITPLSLSIETLSGIMTKLINCNTTISMKKSQVFSTTADSQTTIEVKIFQGEHERVQDNKLPGNFNLVGIPPALKGIPLIGITFDINADGIVHVTAKDKATSKDQSMMIMSLLGLSDKDIGHMISNAKKYADADRACQELIKEANRGKSVCVDTEKVKDQLDAAKREVLKPIGKLHELALKGLTGNASVTAEQIKEKISET